MNDIVRAAPSALSTDVANKLLKGIGESRAQTIIGGGGKPLLRLLRHGEWVYGQEDTEVVEGSLWVVNPLSIAHGYSCWSNYDEKGKKNELLGEAMAPIFEHKPAKPEPINGFGFNEQRAFELKCIEGEDEGVEIQHKVSSVGGMRAVDGLLSAMQGQLSTNPAYPCPVIELEVDSYQHSKWGKVFTPIFTLRGWADMNGRLYSEESGLPQSLMVKTEAAAEPEPAPRQRRAAAAPTKQEEPSDMTRAYSREELDAARAGNAEQAPEPQRSGMPRRRPGQR